MTRTEKVEVDRGAVPVTVVGPDDLGDLPALVVVPSIFGPAPDLLRRLDDAVGDDTLVAVPDPFWRDGQGALAYEQRDAAMSRLADFDFATCAKDMAAVAGWARGRSNGYVVAVGICFGGPYVLRLAARQQADAIVTWHGSRMQDSLHLAPDITCPVRHHLGDADPMTPPEVIDAIRHAFADHPDARIVVHPGADHGFTHDGPAWNEQAYQAGIDDVIALLAGGR